MLISKYLIVAKHRGEKSLPPLVPFVIDVISGDSRETSNLTDQDTEKQNAAKMSSTYIREWIVKHNEATST